MNSGIDIFNKLTDEQVNLLSIDEIKEMLKPLMVGLVIKAPIIPSGSFFYRARALNAYFKKENGITKSEIIYPKHEFAQLGRANRKGNPMFYCSLSKEIIFYEVPNLVQGTELIISFWCSNRRMIVNNIGYTQYLFEEMGARRQLPSWAAITEPTESHAEIIMNSNSIAEDVKQKIYCRDINHEVRHKMSTAFMRFVTDENKHLYKISTALSELHLGTLSWEKDEQLAGIIYPSVRTDADGDNLALLPTFVDNHLELKKCVHLRIDKIDGKKIALTYLDHAETMDEYGKLQWLGRLPTWNGRSGQSAKCIATEGHDKFGDYIIGTDGKRLHWVVKDMETGEPIPAI